MKKTSLNDIHKKLAAKMVEFFGWEMPVQYSGIIDEHLAVRTRVGVFDVSHMGEIFFRGKDALKQIQRLTCNDASKLQIGQAQYSALTTPQGTFVDDILVHKISDDEYFFCVNAATADKDFEWIISHRVAEVEIINRSAEFSQIAVQGPKAVDVVKKLTAFALENLKNYRFASAEICAEKCILARTGYTGEDGFEVYCSNDKAEKIWNAVMEAGKEFDIRPCGLGARDTLRLEAGMCLYGQDMDETTTVLEADLGWILKLDKGDFIGRDALLKQKEAGIKKRLSAFEMIDAGIARHGYDVLLNGVQIGQVTSGSPAPFIKKNIGLAYIPVEKAAPGAEIEIDLRGRRARAQIIQKPPYKRKRQE